VWFRSIHNDNCKTQLTKKQNEIKLKMIISRSFPSLLILVVGLVLALSACEAFVPMTFGHSQATRVASQATAKLHMGPSFDGFHSSSLDVSAATLDPTTVLSDVFSGILGTPLILAVPIVAALGVATLIAWFIVSYANPEVDDE
jgi:flagellar basal body-associated protein FliL